MTSKRRSPPLPGVLKIDSPRGRLVEPKQHPPLAPFFYMTRLILAFAFLFLSTASAQADLRGDLKARMARWEKLMIQIQTGMVRGNMGLVQRTAAELAQTEPLPKAIREALQAHMTEREAKDYGKIDAYISSTAKELSQAAGNEEVQRMLVFQGRLLMSCVQCHEVFQLKAVKALKATGR